MTRRSLANPVIGAHWAQSQRMFGMPELWRVARWGLAGAGAIALAVYASSTETGRDRMRLAVAQSHGVDKPSGANSAGPLDGLEGRRLAEMVRALAADRERILARIATIEQSMDDITGSIARVEKAARAVQPPPEFVAAPREGVSAATVPNEDITSSTNAAASVPRRVPGDSPAWPPAPNPAVKTEFGIDLGGASAIEGLRALWVATQRRHGAQLAGLRPTLHLRERARPGGAELRLVAGPIANAATAARLCAAVAATGAACQAVVFDGQRLVLR